MAKRYSEGEFLRKIRRALMADGLHRAVRLVDKPSYACSTSPRLVEIRTTLADGTCLIHHHNTNIPGGPADVERICAEHRDRPGLTVDRVEEILAGAKPALRTGDGLDPLIVRYASDMPLMVMAPVLLHDIAGRAHERTAALASGPVAPWWKRHEDVQTLEMGMDRSRRTPGGKPRALRIDGGLADTLRRAPEGAKLLDDIVAALKNGIDQGGKVDEHTPITIDGINMTVHGLPLSAGPRGIRLKNMARGGAMLTGTTLTVPRRLPETLLIAIAGRRLDEIIDKPPLDGGIVVLRATARQNGTALLLDMKSSTPDQLRAELAKAG